MHKTSLRCSLWGKPAGPERGAIEHQSTTSETDYVLTSNQAIVEIFLIRSRARPNSSVQRLFFLKHSLSKISSYRCSLHCTIIFLFTSLQLLHKFMKYKLLERSVWMPNVWLSDLKYFILKEKVSNWVLLQWHIFFHICLYCTCSFILCFLIYLF